MRTVSDIARLTGVTVRTLHHYDAIGLLVPSARSDAGYRLYTDDDVLRLRSILVLRELGLSLGAIGEHLRADPEERRRQLEDHRAALRRRAESLAEAVRAVDREIAELARSVPPDGADGAERTEMSDATIEEIFGDFDPREYDDEVKARWGETEAYAESARRTASYGPAEYRAIKQELAAIHGGLAALMQAGVSPDSDDAMDLAEAHRQHIGRWFYDCSRAMHAAVAAGYTEDPRFTRTYERVAEGLAAYVRAAAEANAARE